MVSDRGTAYSSKCFAAYCDTHAIQHIQNAARPPQANGQVERVNELIVTYLRTSSEDKKEWDDALPKFQWIINSQSNKTIGCSPNEVIFRYELRNEADNKQLAALHETQRDDERPPIATLDEIAAAVDDFEKEKWKRRYDARHRAPKQYAVDDLVLVEHVAPVTGQSRPLEPKYRGPYMVKKVLGRDQYLVSDIDVMQRNQRILQSVFASKKLKPWCSLGPETNESDTGTDEESDEANAVRHAPRCAVRTSHHPKMHGYQPQGTHMITCIILVVSILHFKLEATSQGCHVPIQITTKPKVESLLPSLCGRFCANITA